MLIDGTKTDIKSIHSSGEVDALEKIRLEMIEMLRIDEECQIVDEKIRIKVKKEEKVTSNLETLITPLEKEIDKCLSLRRSSRNIKKSNYNDPNDSLDCLKILKQDSGFTEGNECETFSVKFEPDVDVEILNDITSSKNIKIDKIGTTKKAKMQREGKSEPKTLDQLRKSNSIISKSFENSDKPNKYEPESKFTQINNEEKTTREAGDSKTPIKSGQLSSEFYMKGDVMWFISIKKVLKDHGIKGYSQIKDLGILPSDEIIHMELRVASDDTIFSNSEGYVTKCLPVGKAGLVSADQKLIRHEFLHPYSECDENLEMVREIFERQTKNRKRNFSIFMLVDQLRKQQNLYQKILKEIPNTNEHFDYLTGVKTLPVEEISVEQDVSSSSDSDQDIEEISTNHDENQKALVHDDLIEKVDNISAKKVRKSRRVSGCPYDLDGISNDNVIEFFKKSQTLRDHWQKIMDEGECERHKLALTSRDMSCHSELQHKANITFLKQTSEKDGENVDVKLYRITREIVNQHAKIGKLTEQTQDRYAKHVLIPEGCEQYLMDTFKMSEKVAKDWFLKYHANEEDEIFDDEILLEDEEENVFHSENRLGSPLYTIEESENEDLIPDFETNSD